MEDKSELAIATSQAQNPIPFLIELLFNLLSQMITVSTIKLTCHPVRAGRIKKEKDLIGPIIFKVTLNAVGFEQWLAQHLLPSLKNPSVLIVDNSSIYRKNVIRELVEVGGHQLLFLPKYSPDLNEIEHDFSASKRARMYSPINTSFDEIIRGYCDNSVSFLFKKNYIFYFPFRQEIQILHL